VGRLVFQPEADKAVSDVLNGCGADVMMWVVFGVIVVLFFLCLPYPPKDG
jgi:hypothetical protein